MRHASMCAHTWTDFTLNLLKILTRHTAVKGYQYYMTEYNYLYSTVCINACVDNLGCF